MELRTFTLQPTHLFPTFTCCVKPYNFQHSHKNDFSLKISRRNLGLIIFSRECIIRTENANAFEFGLVAPDQTVEEAQNVVRVHAQDLLQVRNLLESESWKIAQKVLRRSSALLKKDIYTIIQSKPGSERPQLRKLYSTLFNNVTRLDYAARDKDGPEVWQRYEIIVAAVNDILSRI
ncbi:psbQ-like protein 3, chloroplastic [Cicer arietinum]|uniref:PsbQ-like protein 3, chloroplastic n=1 Tax=Cicer arietinum TaxID=3827 RepID=A0A1S2Y8D2_CICAR|nr:psbQ-like protein 3, chloroplastic [Cicer arietinum]XP_004500475.1 psbQ-like protein 3, chloroplastic [Cicer arietinum]